MTISVSALIATSFVMMNGCRSPQARFENQVQRGRCEDAMNNLPSDDPMIKITQKSSQAAKVATYYTAVGAGYAAEVLWDASAGLLEGVLLCAPMIAASAASQGAPMVGPCFNESEYPKLKHLYAPPLGKQVGTDLKYLKCPKLVGLSRSLRAVSACYSKLGQTDKARSYLQKLKDSYDFYNCLPQEEQDAVSAQLKAT